MYVVSQHLSYIYMCVLHDYYSSRTSFVGMEDEAIAMYWTPCEDAEVVGCLDRTDRTDMGSWGHGLGRTRTPPDSTHTRSLSRRPLPLFVERRQGRA